MRKPLIRAIPGLPRWRCTWKDAEGNAQSLTASRRAIQNFVEGLMENDDVSEIRLRPHPPKEDR